MHMCVSVYEHTNKYNRMIGDAFYPSGMKLDRNEFQGKYKAIYNPDLKSYEGNWRRLNISTLSYEILHDILP